MRRTRPFFVLMVAILLIAMFPRNAETFQYCSPCCTCGGITGCNCQKPSVLYEWWYCCDTICEVEILNGTLIWTASCRYNEEQWDYLGLRQNLWVKTKRKLA